MDGLHLAFIPSHYFLDSIPVSITQDMLNVSVRVNGNLRPTEASHVFEEKKQFPERGNTLI